LQGFNPYGIDAGRELDQLIHQHCFGSEGELLPFSTESKAAEKVKARMKGVHGYPVVTGETKLRTRRFFARLETGPSTATEVLAETLPLAICRLALVVTLKTAQSFALLSFFFVD
jgi:hypothetical protein